MTVSQASKSIQNYIKTTLEFQGISFDKIEERDYVAFISDELSPTLKRSFGGDYESTVTFRYSLNYGFECEVYFSSAKARQVGASVPSLVRQTIQEEDFTGDMTVVFTPYRPGDSALTFTLTLNTDQLDADFTLVVLGGVFGAIAAKLR